MPQAAGAARAPDAGPAAAARALRASPDRLTDLASLPGGARPPRRCQETPESAHLRQPRSLSSSTHLLVLNFAFSAPKGACGGRRARVGKAPPLGRGAACGKLREDVDLSPRQPPGPLGCLAGLGGRLTAVETRAGGHAEEPRGAVSGPPAAAAASPRALEQQEHPVPVAAAPL